MATPRMTSQKRLNFFVSLVAFLERAGNGLGRILLIWATVVVGFSKKLGEHFAYLAVIIILESFRAFSRESKSDDQLLFKTTGSIKVKRVSLRIQSLYYVNEVIITVFLFLVIIYVFGRTGIPLYYTNNNLEYDDYLPDINNPILLSILIFLSKASKLAGLPKVIEKMSKSGRSWRFKLIPLFVLLVATFIKVVIYNGLTDVVSAVFVFSVIPQWFFLYYLVTVQSPAAHPCMQKYWRPVLALTIAGSMWGAFKQFALWIMLAPLLLRNFQIPLSINRIGLGFSRLFLGEFGDLDADSKNGTHVVATLKILYIMLICQGILYILACVFESFSYFFRASLALHCGLVDKMGMKSIGHYYQHAYETFVQESVLGTKEMSLVNFAVDSVNADVTRDKKLSAVLILNSFLQQDEEAFNREVASQVTASTKAVGTLITMLGWTVPEGASPTKEVSKDADVRLFATKVVANLAPHLRIVGIPGTMQMVSSLLDAENKPAREDSSAQIIDGSGGTRDTEITHASSSSRVDGNRGAADNQDTEIQDASSSPIMDRTVEGNGGTGDQETRDASSPPRVDGNRGTAGNQETEMQEMSHNADLAGDIERGNADNQPPIKYSSAQATGDHEGSSTVKDWICKTWQHYMKDIWSIPRDSWKDEDSIPILGVLILERLAHDVDNCTEISRSTEILPKIIGFISHITDTTTMQQKQIITSSLTLVAKLASLKGEIGVTFREYLSENPLLLRKLAEILEDSGSGPEQWKPTMDIIAKLAMYDIVRKEIGGIQVIIAKLMHIFLGQDESPNTSSDPSLRKVAGEALAMLSIGSPLNCSAMLDEPGYNLTKNLMDMLTVQDPDGEHVYLAAILLQSMCTHSGRKLRHNQDPNQPISSVLPTVLDRIMKPESEGKQLEALISLASQICILFPGSINPPGRSLPDAGALAQKLVVELNANKRPRTEIPTMRRRLVELAISMMTERPTIYAEAFRNNGMMEALSMVEKTSSMVERYRLFCDGIGLFPEGVGDVALPDLVAEAKWLMIEPAAQ